MPSLKAIIFDVDGTLADTEEHHRVAFNASFAEFGLDWHWSVDTYRRLLRISGGRERMLVYASEPGVSAPVTDDLPRYIAQLHQHKTARFGAWLASGQVGLRPGVLRLINEAQDAGIRLAIATSTAYSNVRNLLNANLPADWQDWFDVIASADDISTKKPSPAVYRYALLKLGLRAEHCVAIEDTHNGLRAAQGAGLTTLITTNVYTEHESFQGASLVVDQLGEPGLACVARHRPDIQWVDLGILQSLHEHHLEGGYQTPNRPLRAGARLGSG